MATAGIYLRISDDRAGTGLGVERQEADCRAMCERLGWAVGAVYTDNDISAYSGKPRPSYRRLLDDVKAGAVDAIVAWHPDRLHRSPRELEEFIDIVEASGATVQTSQAGTYDLTTPTGRMQARIVGAVARHESEHKSERIRRQKEQAAGHGTDSGGPRPFGYARRDGKLVVVPSEAKEIRAAYENLHAGVTLSAITRDWNARQVSDRAWNKTTVRLVLTRPRIAGYRVHRGSVVKGVTPDWAAIVTGDEFAIMSALMNSRRLGQREHRTPSLLGGLAVCGLCGRAMTVRSAGMYRCSLGSGGCGGVSVTSKLLDAAVSEEFLAVIAAPEFLGTIEAPATPDAAPVLDGLRVAEDRLAEIAEAYGTGELDFAAYKTAHAAASKRVAAIRGRLSETVSESTAGQLPAAEDVLARWAEADIAQRRVWLQALVERVEVQPSKTPQGSWDPDRYEVIWRI